VVAPKKILLLLPDAKKQPKRICGPTGEEKGAPGLPTFGGGTPALLEVHKGENSGTRSFPAFRAGGPKRGGGVVPAWVGNGPTRERCSSAWGQAGEDPLGGNRGRRNFRGCGQAWGTSDFHLSLMAGLVGPQAARQGCGAGKNPHGRAGPTFLSGGGDLPGGGRMAARRAGARLPILRRFFCSSWKGPNWGEPQGHFQKNPARGGGRERQGRIRAKGRGDPGFLPKTSSGAFCSAGRGGPAGRPPPAPPPQASGKILLNKKRRLVAALSPRPGRPPGTENPHSVSGRHCRRGQAEFLIRPLALAADPQDPDPARRKGPEKPPTGRAGIGVTIQGGQIFSDLVRGTCRPEPPPTGAQGK